MKGGSAAALRHILTALHHPDITFPADVTGKRVHRKTGVRLLLACAPAVHGEGTASLRVALHCPIDSDLLVLPSLASA